MFLWKLVLHKNFVLPMSVISEFCMKKLITSMKERMQTGFDGISEI